MTPSDLVALVARLRMRFSYVIMPSPTTDINALASNYSPLQLEAAAAIEQLQAELDAARIDRDEWKQQHENLLAVKDQDNAALVERIREKDFYIGVLEAQRDNERKRRVEEAPLDEYYRTVFKEGIKASQEIEALRAELAAVKQDADKMVEALTLIAGTGPNRAECSNPRYVAAQALYACAQGEKE